MYLHTLHQAVSRLLPNGGLVATGSYNLPTVWGTKIFIKEPERVHKNHDSQANFR